MSEQDGGPAFPQDLQGRRGDDPSLQGMSLRDWFAGTYSPPPIEVTPAAASELLGVECVPGNVSDDVVFQVRVLAKIKYLYADAMLAERAKRHE